MLGRVTYLQANYTKYTHAYQRHRKPLPTIIHDLDRIKNNPNSNVAGCAVALLLATVAETAAQWHKLETEK